MPIPNHPWDEGSTALSLAKSAASPTQTDDLKVGSGSFPRVLLSERGVCARQAELKMSIVLGKRSLAGSCSHRNEGLRERRGALWGEAIIALGWAGRWRREDAPHPQGLEDG